MTKYILTLSALMLLILGSEELLIKTIVPQYDFKLLPAIPIFFTVFGTIMIKMVYIKENPSVAAILGAKMLKVLLSLVIIMTYVLVVKENNKAFLGAYLICFIGYLGFETWMLSYMNKKKE